MSQDVALPSQQSPTEVAIAPPPPPGETGALVQWAYEARQAALIAQSLVQSSFVPESLRKRPQDVTVAILAGHEMGLLPMATLRSIDVIHGNPALRATAMRGLLQSRGHSIQLLESTDDRCVMRGRRKGEDQWQTVEWTIERARMLGLVGKDQWRKQPRTMLIARATGEICRLVASDLLQAMPYNAEETADEYDETPPARVSAAELAGQGVSPAPPAASGPTAPSAETSPSASSPESATPPPTQADPTPAPRQRTPARDKPATKAQLSKIHMLAGELGLSTKEGEREEFDAMVNAAAARTEGSEVASTKDLNQQEAGWVIEAFTKRVEAAPKTSETTQGEAPAGDEPVDAVLEDDGPKVPADDRDYWARLIYGAERRGYNEAQIRRALEMMYGQPVEDLTKEQLAGFTTKVALGTAQIPTLEELESDG